MKIRFKGAKKIAAVGDVSLTVGKGEFLGWFRLCQVNAVELDGGLDRPTSGAIRGPERNLAECETDELAR